MTWSLWKHVIEIAGIGDFEENLCLEYKGVLILPILLITPSLCFGNKFIFADVIKSNGEIIFLY